LDDDDFDEDYDEKEFQEQLDGVDERESKYRISGETADSVSTNRPDLNGQA
jgi:hypothetical protein